MTGIDRYAVFGHPIGHSRSPRIHARFAEQTGQSLVYFAQDVELRHFEPAVRRFFQDGGRGINCTVPLKEAAFRLADTLSERAERCKAVNTLALLEDGELFGDNTDGIGLIRDLTGNLGIPLGGRQILILGAGGACRGILAPLLAEQPDWVAIANRTPAKAVRLAAEFCDLGEISACRYEDLAAHRFDLIVNATAASLSGALPALPDGVLNPEGCCYDLGYGAEPTAFVRWGHDQGARLSVDGIGMLVEQAAEAFFIWRRVRPETRSVIELLESERKLHAHGAGELRTTS